MMKPFNVWLYERWLDHIEECLYIYRKMPDYVAKQYFENYKWWLKDQYKQYVKEEKEL